MKLINFIKENKMNEATAIRIFEDYRKQKGLNDYEYKLCYKYMFNIDLDKEGIDNETKTKTN